MFPSSLPESSHDEEFLEYLSMLAKARRFIIIHFHFFKVVFSNYVIYFFLSAHPFLPSNLASLKLSPQAYLTRLSSSNSCRL
jgi:hypothetical protein